jgi:hypothetical protein
MGFGIRLLTALPAVMLLVPLESASAQRRRGLTDITPPLRHGFWLNAGVAAGSENVRFSREPGGWGEENVQPAMWFALGGTVNQHLRLGGEINGWVWEHRDRQTDYQLTDYLVGALLTGQFYPSSRAGFFLKGGVGLSRSGTQVQGGLGVGETGFAYLAGAGWEIRLGRSVFLTPSVNVMNHRSNPDPNDPESLGTMHERVVTLGVGVTVQPGR